MSTPDHIEIVRLLLTKAAADLSAARLLAQAEDQDDVVYEIEEPLGRPVALEVAEAAMTWVRASVDASGAADG